MNLNENLPVWVEKRPLCLHSANGTNDRISRCQTRRPLWMRKGNLQVSTTFSLRDSSIGFISLTPISIRGFYLRILWQIVYIVNSTLYPYACLLLRCVGIRSRQTVRTRLGTSLSLIIAHSVSPSLSLCRKHFLPLFIMLYRILCRWMFARLSANCDVWLSTDKRLLR